MASLLHQFLDEAAVLYPDRIAVEGADGESLSYRELAARSDRLAHCLRRAGVRSGDRVALYLQKSIVTVVWIFAVLKAGAAYVPVDPSGPPRRGAFILNDCGIRLAIVESHLILSLRSALEAFERASVRLVLERHDPRDENSAASDLPASSLRAADLDDISADGLAYILYTSGSTGKPKGVMLSHRNATSFVDWCSETFEPKAEDRFSSHAPFHFDLSILDIYVPLKHGATLVLIGEEEGKQPTSLARLISERRISVWYSTPSVLSLLTQYGRMAHLDYSSCRLVLFAGEVFPIKHLRTLQADLPKPRYFNLYGPTETNVCTFFEVPTPIEDDRTEPFPIGQSCSHCRTRVVDPSGRDVEVGEPGELCVSGPSVMRGYWQRPERTARVFLAGDTGEPWYKTGDIVIEGAGQNYTFIGRRDRMVKRRGYRVELGEIEAGLYLHPAVREVAVLAVPDEEYGVSVQAFLSCEKDEHPSPIELKRFSAQNLNRYMIPDVFTVLERLPKTSTDKIDYQALAELGPAPGSGSS